MLVNLLGYWFLGLPVSYLLGFRLGLGPIGLWWGLVLGLAVVATILLVRVRIALARRAAPGAHRHPPLDPRWMPEMAIRLAAAARSSSLERSSARGVAGAG